MLLNSEAMTAVVYGLFGWERIKML